MQAYSISTNNYTELWLSKKGVPFSNNLASILNIRSAIVTINCHYPQCKGPSQNDFSDGFFL